jgi:hypothetical protein
MSHPTHERSTGAILRVALVILKAVKEAFMSNMFNRTLEAVLEAKRKVEGMRQ